MKGPIQSVEVSCLVHSTEDEGRLRRAMEGMLGLDASARSEELEGHHGNRIVRVSYSLTGDAASSAFSKLVSSLPLEARDELAGSLGATVDEHHALYLRLDKQALVSGRLALGGSESVRIRVKPRLFLMKEGTAEFYRDALGRGR